jgi:hypothetical protein
MQRNTWGPQVESSTTAHCAPERRTAHGCHAISQRISEFLGGITMGRHRYRAGTNELPRLDLRSPECKAVLQGAPRPDSGRPPGRLLANGTPVELAFSPCRFGGYRPWVVCESCGRRRVVLYGVEFITRWMQGDEVESETRRYSWRCRRCWHLTYPSQRASRNRGYYAQLRIQALYRRYYPDWRYAMTFPDKPPHVRRTTWEKVQEQVSYWEGRRDEVFFERMAGLLWRSGWRPS